MTDIYDIKSIILWNFINIYYSILYIIFVIILYFIFKKFFVKKKFKKPHPNPLLQEREKDFDFEKKLKDFEKIFLNKNSEIFYSKLIEILKEILQNSWIKNISKMTFEEINNLKIKQNLKDLIKQIYYKEYKLKIKDSEEIRKNLISEVKKLIK